jgi:multicomponent Na+:H+ antiporter subunit F
MTVVIAAALAMLGAAAALVVVRLFKGPSNLDRIVAAEILLVIVIAGVALESSRQRTTTYLPLLMILGLVGFVGGVAVTRFLSRDSDDPAAVVRERTDQRPDQRTDQRTDQGIEEREQS